ncbi:MAG: hypothetical protein ABR912_04165 [Terracidiphilus sp.]
MLKHHRFFELYGGTPIILFLLSIPIHQSAAQTHTVCDVSPANDDAVLTVVSIRSWRQGDEPPAPDVIGLTTAKMIYTRYRLSNYTKHSLYYLAEPGTIVPVSYTVYKPDDSSDWMAPMRGREGFGTSSSYQWLELPPQAIVEFERGESHWGYKYQGLAVFINEHPRQKGRREIISNPFLCKAVGIEPSSSNNSQSPH